VEKEWMSAVSDGGSSSKPGLTFSIVPDSRESETFGPEFIPSGKLVVRVTCEAQAIGFGQTDFNQAMRYCERRQIA